MFKNKLALLTPIIALLVVFIFSLTLFPTVQPQPKNLPVAIVNEDQGLELPDQPAINMGQTIVEMIQQNSAGSQGANQEQQESPVKWIEVESLEAMQQGLNEQEYYAALVIPADFSAKQASLRTPAPSLPEVQIYINQGMNMAAATAAGQILNGVVDMMNSNVRTQLLQGFEAQGATLTVEQAANLAAPITKKVINVNEVGQNSANGNAPISFFQPLWMAVMASSAIIFLAVSKLVSNNRKQNLINKLGQIVLGAVAAIFIGFGFTWIADGMVGLNIPDFLDTALFLAITAFSFFLMISAILSLIGIKGVGVFALMLFFGAPLLSMAPEMMSSFYREWIYPWLPMRFMTGGLRELLFFGKSLASTSSVATLVWIGAVGIVVILATALKGKPATANTAAAEQA